MLLLALASPASAGTLVWRGDCSYRYYCSHEVTYTAAPGERNDVTVTRPEGAVLVHDAGAPVTGCEPIDPYTARCSPPVAEPVLVTVLLGDGDDVAHSTGADVEGGAG